MVQPWECTHTHGQTAPAPILLPPQLMREVNMANLCVCIRVFVHLAVSHWSIEGMSVSSLDPFPWKPKCCRGNMKKWVSWLWNVSGTMVRHYCHGISIPTHSSLVISSFLECFYTKIAPLFMLHILRKTDSKCIFFIALPSNEQQMGFNLIIPTYLRREWR